MKEVCMEGVCMEGVCGGGGVEKEKEKGWRGERGDGMVVEGGPHL